MTDENNVPEEINGTEAQNKVVTENKKRTKERRNYKKDGENPKAKRNYKKQEENIQKNGEEVITKRTKRSRNSQQSIFKKSNLKIYFE